MIAIATGKRLFAALVLTFVGFNAVSMACLSHCNFGPANDVAAASSTTEHDSTSNHCDRKTSSEDVPDTAVNAGGTDHAADCMYGTSRCCDPADEMLTAAVKFGNGNVPALSPEPTVAFFLPTAVFVREQVSTPVYRPPPRDQRIDRKLNCVIRI